MIVEWQRAAGKIQAIYIDTTKINTGYLRGTCVSLEKLLEKNLYVFSLSPLDFKNFSRAIFITTTSTQPGIFAKFFTGWSTKRNTKSERKMKTLDIK